MAIPVARDPVVDAAEAAIKKARKSLQDPDFLAKLQPTEQVTFEKRLKDAEDALEEYRKAPKSSVTGVLGASTTMDPLSSALIAGMMAIAWMAFQANPATQEANRKLAKALLDLGGHAQQIEERPKIDTTKPPPPPTISVPEAGGGIGALAVATAVAAVMTWEKVRHRLWNLAAVQTLKRILEDFEKDPKGCNKFLAEALDACKDVLKGLNNTQLVTAQGGRLMQARINKLVEALQKLYSCLGLQPPSI